MITEDYCSFEIAKFLKEEGFDEYCLGMWHLHNGKKIFEVHYELLNYNELRDGILLAPTHQMAMKWLREVHHIVMSISPTCGMLGQFNGYLIIIDKIVDGVLNNQDEFGLDTLSYEEAVEAALKYSLENLIKDEKRNTDNEIS